MRLSACLVAILATLTLGVAAAQTPGTWSPAATIRTCAPASSPKVVFPYSLPQDRSGFGAILWLGGAPACGAAGASGTTLDGATVHSDDTLSVARALWPRSGLGAPLTVAGTTHGQVVAALHDGSGTVYGEGDAGYAYGKLRPLGRGAALIATANGYIGDADIVTAQSAGARQTITLLEQRHYESSFDLERSFSVGAPAVTTLTVGMDFRGDSIIVWAQAGVVYARWITNAGQVYATDQVGRTGYEPQLAAVLSDNNHAFVMWTDEPAPGAPGPTTIYLVHSGDDVTFGTPKPLATFTEPAQQRLTPGALALVRMSPSEGVLAAWTSLSPAGDYMVSGAGLTSGGALAPGTISQPGVDLRLAALAAGPHDDAVAVLESAPRAARGFAVAQQQIEAARTVPGGPGGTAFGTPTVLAGPGQNSAPSVAIDPHSDDAFVAWQTSANGTPAVAYSVRAGRT
jgi:hypothetical protein